MKIFENFNESGKCHICGTNKPGKCVLIPLDNTEDGNNEQAIQVHLDCIALRAKTMMDNTVFLYQVDKDNADVCKNIIK